VGSPEQTRRVLDAAEKEQLYQHGFSNAAVELQAELEHLPQFTSIWIHGLRPKSAQIFEREGFREVVASMRDKYIIYTGLLKEAVQGHPEPDTPVGRNAPTDVFLTLVDTSEIPPDEKYSFGTAACYTPKPCSLPAHTESTIWN